MTISEIKKGLTLSDEDIEKIIKAVTEHLDAELTKEKCCDLIMEVAQANKDRESATGEYMDMETLPIAERIMWVAREAYRLGAAYGITVMSMTVNQAVEAIKDE